MYGRTDGQDTEGGNRNGKEGVVGGAGGTEWSWIGTAGAVGPATREDENIKKNDQR